MSRLFTSARQRLYHLLFDPETVSGHRFEGLCGLFALISVIIIFIESGAGTQYHMTYEEWHVFVWLELIVTLVFTAEYVLRVISWPNPAKYVFSFWGFIDLATILPLYVMWLWPEISLNYVFARRAMRAIRVLRILKLLRFMPSLRVLGRHCQRPPPAYSLLFVYCYRDDRFWLPDVFNRRAKIRVYHA